MADGLAGMRRSSARSLPRLSDRLDRPRRNFLLAGIAALTIFSGYLTLRPPENARSDNENIKTRALIAVGAISGYISVLVGAGGAVVLIPLLFAMGAPALLAIGLSQAI